MWITGIEWAIDPETNQIGVVFIASEGDLCEGDSVIIPVDGISLKPQRGFPIDPNVVKRFHG